MKFSTKPAGNFGWLVLRFLIYKINEPTKLSRIVTLRGRPMVSPLYSGAGDLRPRMVTTFRCLQSFHRSNLDKINPSFSDVMTTSARTSLVKARQAPLQRIARFRFGFGVTFNTMFSIQTRDVDSARGILNGAWRSFLIVDGLETVEVNVNPIVYAVTFRPVAKPDRDRLLRR